MNDFSNRWQMRIFAAQRDLIEECGGIARVIEKSSYSKSQVGRWNGGADRDLMPVNVVLMLEADCGRPLVTQIMAEFNGRGLTDPVDRGERIACLSQQVADLVAQAGKMVVETARAKADGIVTPNEATALRGTLSDISRLTAEIEDLLAAVQAHEKDSPASRAEGAPAGRDIGPDGRSPLRPVAGFGGGGAK